MARAHQPAFSHQTHHYHHPPHNQHHDHNHHHHHDHNNQPLDNVAHTGRSLTTITEHLSPTTANLLQLLP